MGGASMGSIEDLPAGEQAYVNERLVEYHAAQQKKGLARRWAMYRWRRNQR